MTCRIMTIVISVPFNSSSWQRDPTHPFLPPEHLREAVDRFEKTEVPRLGLKPNPMTTPTTEEAMTSSHKSSSLADVDFVFS